MRAIAVLLASAVAGLGCGGDDDGGGSLAKSEYIEKADAICAEADRVVSQALTEYFSGQTTQPSTEAIARFGIEVAIPRLKEVVADLRDLPAPAGDEATLTTIYDKLDAATADLERDPSQIAGKQTPAAFVEPNRLAQEYGFKVCGEP